MHVPDKVTLEQAITAHLAEAHPVFVPDVDVELLPDGDGRGRAELFLSFRRFRDDGNAAALRGALDAVRKGLESRAILDLRDATVAEEEPGIFNEGRERVVLAAHLAYAL